MSNLNITGTLKSNGTEVVKIDAVNAEVIAFQEKLGMEWVYVAKGTASNFTEFWYNIPDITVYDYKFVIDEFWTNDNERDLRFGITTTNGGSISGENYSFENFHGWGDSIKLNRNSGVAVIRNRGKSNSTAELIIQYDALITMGVGSGTMTDKSHVFRFWSRVQSTGMTVNYYGVQGEVAGVASYLPNGRWIRFNGTTINGDNYASIAQCKFRVYKRKKAVY